MAFIDYKSMEDVLRKEPVIILNEAFLPEQVTRDLPDWFLQDITFALSIKRSQENEAFYEEFFIVPFLKEIWKHHRNIKVWSHIYIQYDDDLCGNPDYIVSALHEAHSYEVLSTPLLAAIQAKQQNFIAGWGQCLAAMLACQKINADHPRDDQPLPPVYGIVSTGEIWEFGKLEAHTLKKYPAPISIANPVQLAGVLDYIFSECERVSF
ncbi:hypothetical protein [Candidatus Thiosymbion oneisti]|uniref:hypothetical protein n=1 Tax=Candidatus Thiosymbion oneisti TaxID=589554 RepID=UPI00105F4F15|nr:hypothetical protein [Candidatus Thiosymbion oneisti]